MEIPICVADANTLIDYIHDIKRWIYNGKLRLVVPPTTYEHVEQIYQNTKEAKPVQREAVRPKSSGKPAKKEYPVFDINPLLARNFLSRLKTWKQEDAASDEQKSLQEKENHGAVSFQKNEEQYTPWKDLEVEEEKPQITEDRPVTWAEALRRKQNLANGSVGNSEMRKGPPKPRLVSKAVGSETSPWKIKKDAPKISAKDVPANLRPMMSCVLWRLHESIDRNDANELFLLCDQPDIRTVAQTLNITVRSAKELGVLVAAKAKRDDLDSFGDLEREFNMPPRVVVNPALSLTPPKQTLDEHMETVDDVSLMQANLGALKPNEEEKLEDNHVMDAGKSVVSEGSQGITYDEQAREDIKNGVEGTENALVKSKTPSIEETTSERPVASRAADAEAYSHRHPKEQTIAQANGYSPAYSSTKGISSPGTSLVSGTGLENAPEVLHREVLTDAGLESTVVQVPPKPGQQTLDHKSSEARSTAGPTPSHSTDIPQEPEDSDEEVVVFVPQPKRFSNQKKPSQQSSRPSTPNTQPQKSLPDPSPKHSPLTGQVHAKPPSCGKVPLPPGHPHPQSTSSPTVIDPDAFGRSFAVKPNPNPRIPHNSRSHHRPRTSGEITHLAQGPRSSRQLDPQIDHPRQSSHNKSPRGSPESGPKINGDINIKAPHNQRTSPQRRSKVLEAEGVAPRGRGSNRAMQGVQPPPKTLVARMVNSEEFIPRAAFTEPQFGPIGTPPKVTEPQNPAPTATDSSTQVKSNGPEAPVVETTNISPRNPRPILENRTRAIEPRLSKSNEFIPRSAMPIMQYKQRTPEPDVIEPRASMPDVQYILKSGSTRAATRGRGRLWTPS